MSFSFRVIAVSAALLGASAQAQVLPTFSNVQYGDGLAAQRLDVYVPAGAPALRPCVVWIHGGGWQNGSKFPAPKAPSLLALGFVVVSIDYRLSGEASHPAQIHDCKGAIRFIRARANDYGIDTARIGVWGSSAGGHLVALVGTSGDVGSLEGTVGGNVAFAGPVQAVADFFGPTEFLSITDPGHTSCTSPESLMLGVCLGDVIANQANPLWAAEVSLVRAASPTTHISPNDPPFIISYGTSDPVVQPQQNIILHQALVSAGVPSTLRPVIGAGHGVPPLEDVAARKFLAGMLGATICGGDWNANGASTIQDLFDFLASYFAIDPLADVNGTGGVSVQDIFDFLALYFAACPE